MTNSRKYWYVKLRFSLKKINSLSNFITFYLLIFNVSPGIELGEDAAATYAATIKEYNMLDAEGNIVKELDPVADFDVKATEGVEFPMYVAEVNGETKYILPMNGAGLWGAIWGYMALNDDRNTVYGVFFNHAGETPGLGAEIVTEKFRNPFIGKELLKEGKFASIAVEKPGIKAQLICKTKPVYPIIQ